MMWWGIPTWFIFAFLGWMLLRERREGRRAGRRDAGQAAELDELRARVAELEQDRDRISELEERLDFTERLLSRGAAEPTHSERG